MYMMQRVMHVCVCSSSPPLISEPKRVPPPPGIVCRGTECAVLCCAVMYLPCAARGGARRCCGCVCVHFCGALFFRQDGPPPHRVACPPAVPAYVPAQHVGAADAPNPGGQPGGRVRAKQNDGRRSLLRRGHLQHGQGAAHDARVVAVRDFHDLGVVQAVQAGKRRGAHNVGRRHVCGLQGRARADVVANNVPREREHAPLARVVKTAWPPHALATHCYVARAGGGAHVGAAPALNTRRCCLACTNERQQKPQCPCPMQS